MTNKDMRILKLRQEKERHQNNFMAVDDKFDKYIQDMSERGRQICDLCNKLLNEITDYIDDIDAKLEKLGADLSA